MNEEPRLGTLSALSIGIGGMVGGGIFAVTGLTIQLTRGAAPVAFIVAGVVALLTSYSYLKLTLRFPDNGGTVAFLNHAFGQGVFTGAACIMLCMSYMVLLAIYAYAFGSYGASFLAKAGLGAERFDPEIGKFWLHLLASAVIVGLVVVNIVSSQLVVRSENFINFVKMALLTVFIVGGLATPIDWPRLDPVFYPSPTTIFSGAMIIFLNYEGFELIANAAKDIREPRKALPIAYVGGVLIAIVLYALIAIVVVGHMNFTQVNAESNHALAAAARVVMGKTGFVVILIAALFATSSAINATLYGSGRLTYVIARSGELPTSFERRIRGLPLEGILVFAAAALLLVNFAPLNAIATMGSAGFLLIFAAVNWANVMLARQTQSHLWISLLGTIACVAALMALCWQVWQSPATRDQLWVLAGMLGGSLLIEAAYRLITRREIHVVEAQ